MFQRIIYNLKNAKRNFFGEFAKIDIRINGSALCRAHSDENNSAVTDRSTSSCGGVTTLDEGTLLLNQTLGKVIYLQNFSEHYYSTKITQDCSRK